MFRIFFAVVFLLVGSAGMAVVDFTQRQRDASGLTVSAYVDQLRLRLDGMLRTPDPAADHELSRMEGAIEGVERTGNADAPVDYFGTIQRSVHGTKVKPSVGMGMCRQEGGRKTCSPFAG